LWDKINIGRCTAKPFVIWFTGLPCSGKSTLADKTFDYLLKKGVKAERLDGDTVRSIFPATGFSREDRNTHIKRIGFLASILEKNGIFVVASFVSPYEESREAIKGLCGEFIEVFVSTPLEECERRDVKGMYKRARKGEIKNFTGVSDPYEIPADPDIVIETVTADPETSFKEIQKYISARIK
jgi:adenylylsulfate kinase